MGGRGSHMHGTVTKAQFWWEAGSKLGPRTVKRKRIQNA